MEIGELVKLRIRTRLTAILNNRIFVLVVVLIFILFSSLYFYRLECIYPPNAEELATTFSMYSHMTLGTECFNVDLLYYIVAFLTTKIGGMTYFSIRFHATLLQTILLSGTVFLCLWPKGEENIKMYVLPLICLLSVILFPASDHPEWVWDTGGQDLIYLWPYLFHYSARIYAVACLVFLALLLRSKGRRQVVYGFFMTVVCLYAMKKTDLIFYILFFVPAVIVLFLHAIRKENLRKWGIVFISGFMGILLLCRILPINMFNSLWTKEPVVVYGEIYGGTNWISIDLIGKHLLNYIKLLSLIFNIQLSESPVISLYTVIYVFKTLILVAGHIIMFHVIKCSLTGKLDRHHYDCLDEILAWAYLMLSCIYIFTGFGDIPFARYFTGLITIMTILMCRNVEVIPEIFGMKDWMLKIPYKKCLFFVYMSIVCVCSMDNICAYRAPNGYDEDLKAIAEYIEETGYGYSVSSFWMYTRVSALSEGKVLTYMTPEDIEKVYGAGTKVAYIITHNLNNPADSNAFTIYPHCNTYEEMCEYYSEPSEIIFYDKLQVAVYRDGIKVKK